MTSTIWNRGRRSFTGVSVIISPKQQCRAGPDESRTYTHVRSSYCRGGCDFFFFPSRKNYYELYAYTHYDAPIYLSICLCSRDANTGGSRYSPRRVRNHDNVKSQTSQNKSVQRAQGVIAGYVYRRRSTLRRKQHVSRICYIIITYMMFSNRSLRGS